MQNNRVLHKTFRLQLIFLVILMLLTELSFAQQGKSTLTYYSIDSLLITADEFVTADSLPYVLLIHDQGSSRGEFSNIINRFQKMNFNCLVIDIRNGGNSNFIGNETAKRAKIGRFSRGINAIEGDIMASVDMAFEKSGQKVVLLGAGANGSLALKAAKESNNIKAAIALNPGEFFQPYFSIEDVITGIEKPLLITSCKQEYRYVEKIVSNVASKYKTVFVPDEKIGERGTKALLSSNESSGEYWLALLLFFKDLQ